jgi:hypothetical protein
MSHCCMCTYLTARAQLESSDRWQLTACFYGRSVIHPCSRGGFPPSRFTKTACIRRFSAVQHSLTCTQCYALYFVITSQEPACYWSRLIILSDGPEGGFVWGRGEMIYTEKFKPHYPSHPVGKVFIKFTTCLRTGTVAESFIFLQNNLGILNVISRADTQLHVP